eukprot:TRINITY_DN1850_c0_g1_i1.p1 TRINITY_DN1850_c0_g1~~TRINITY_DN1850_c0_g1_i1.p1  ORF type:complete len:303 (-),score=117.76 TRINITY_DN1850_c0_g1_i1:103-1011(-)
MSLGRTFTLNNGQKIPAVGLGTWQSKADEVRTAVRVALENGYRHIDTAFVYNNEKEVGEGIVESKVPRGEIFLTTKLWSTFHRPEYVVKAMEESLSRLGTSYVDLYLIHWPVSLVPGESLFPLREDGSRNLDNENVDLATTWKAMEGLVESGKAKSIGISNAPIDKLEEILKVCKIKPACNQVELHPWLAQNPLKEFCDKHNILLAAYSPLGSTGSPLASDPVIQEISQRTGKTGAQVLISWAVQRGTCVLPKSVTPERIKSNFEDFVLSEEDMNKINEMEKTTHKRFINPKWGIDVFGSSV